jgi:glycosyltransferase involved in cell wall biosynthesis
VDGRSNDRTLSIVDKNSDLISLVISEEDDGQTDAIGKGFKLASGNIIGWLNSDDTLAPDALKLIYEAFQSSPEVGFVYGRANKMDENGSIIKKGNLFTYDARKLKSHFYITQPACYFRRSCYQRVGGLDRKLEYAMDWDLLLKLSKEYKGLGVDELFANLRIYGQTKTAMGGYERSKEIALLGLQYGGIFNPNWLAFCALYPFEKMYVFTGYKGFLKLRNLMSHLLDRIWGHTNYMIHAHTYSENQL